MKTAMQELINTIDTIVRALPNEALGAKNQAIIIRGKAHSLLEMEKQQIITAYCDGRLSVITKEIISYEQYYNDTFQK